MTPLRRDRLRGIATTAVLAALGMAGCGSGDDLAERQAEVAQRGTEVMPFDLDVTTHRFEPTDDGLVQTVVADDPDDRQQVSLIREHLAAEAEQFTNGDYSDPASIHGEDMPGLAELEAGASAIAIGLEDVPDGARITYTTDDPALVDALHRWADAQVTDHGEHAEHTGDRLVSPSDPPAR